MSRTTKEILHHLIYKRFQKALTTYEMLADGDRILVGLSGGKDSLCLLEMLAERKRIYKPHIEVEALHVVMKGIKYESDMSYLEDFARQRDVRLHIVSTEFDDTTLKIDDTPLMSDMLTYNDSTSLDAHTSTRRKPACFLCSWHRRKAMFRFAQEHGFSKIALGHHMDDIIHTVMLNQFYQGSFATMPVVMEMKKMPLTIIRPLCLEHEADISKYAMLSQYAKQIKLCPYEKSSNRAQMRRVFEQIEKLNPEARYSVWHALQAEHKLVQRR